MNFLSKFKNKLVRANAKTKISSLKRTKKVQKSFVSKRDLTKPIAYAAAIGVVLIFIFLVVNLVSFYSDINLKKSTLDDIKINNNWNGSDKFTILMLGIDDSAPGYRFNDALALIMLNPNESRLSIFIINPDISLYSNTLKRDEHLRTFFYNKSKKIPQMSDLVSAVEQLYTVRIDRYVEVDMKSFIKYANAVSQNVFQVKDNISDGSYNDFFGQNYRLNLDKGQHLFSGIDLLAYVASDSGGNDSKLNRQKDVVESLLTKVDYLKVFTHFNDITELLNNGVRTNLSKDELLLLANSLTRIRKDGIESSITKTASIVKSGVKGVYTVYSPIVEASDNDFSKLIIDDGVIREQARIEVYNATSKRGLASYYSRWINNIGGRVISVGTSPEKVNRTQIYIQAKDVTRFQTTLKEISAIFNDQVDYKYEEYKYRTLGDIIVLVGSDINN